MNAMRASLTMLLLLSLPIRAMAGPPVEDLIRGLGAERFAARQTAQHQLTEMALQQPDTILPVAVRHFATTSDPEIRARLLEVMSNVVHRVVLQHARGYLGIRMQSVAFFDEPPGIAHDTPSRILIVGVMDNSPAARAGLQPGMLIVKLDGEPLPPPNTVEHFSFAIRSRPPGTTVRLHVLDGENLREIPVTLDSLPRELEEQLNLPAFAQRYFEDWLRHQLQNLPPPAAPIDKPPPHR